MYKFLAATAAIALAATGAQADPGKGKGGGNHAGQNHGGGHAKQAQRGGNNNRGPAMHQQRGPQRVAQQGNRGPAMKDDKGRQRRSAPKPAKVDRHVERQRDVSRQVERSRDVSRHVERGREVDRHDIRRVDNRDVRVNRYDDNRRVDRIVRINYDDNRGVINGCPPGLARKHNGCMPPGLAKQREVRYRYREAYYRPDWWGYNSFGSNRAYYDNGYLYRIGTNNSVLGYIPLLGGALSVGNVWPSTYQAVSVPNYYVDYYNLGPQGSYRYANNVLYRVDPQTAAITSIAALLTGDNFTVGQPMPMGYDVYNVPYAYRDRYYDTPDAYYRYSDGYVYQIDPKTQLIAAAIQLLV